MWIAIDTKAHEFLPLVHEDKNVLGDLILTEAATTHIHMEHASHPFLRTMGDLDCIMLYKKTTDQTATVIGDALRALLLELACRLPQVNILPAILNQRAEQVVTTGKHVKPSIALKPVRMPRHPDEKAIIAKPRAARVVAPLPPPAIPVQGTAGARPTGPRMHGVREIVWGFAQQAWEQAGSPKDAPSILKLRKVWMIELEKQGVSRNTCSNELGAWQRSLI